MSSQRPGRGPRWPRGGGGRSCQAADSSVSHPGGLRLKASSWLAACARLCFEERAQKPRATGRETADRLRGIVGGCPPLRCLPGGARLISDGAPLAISGGRRKPRLPVRTSQQDAPPQLMLLTQRIVDSLPSPLVILSLPSLGLEMSLKARARPMPTVEPPLPENWIWGQKTRVWVPARLLPGS